MISDKRVYFKQRRRLCIL